MKWEREATTLDLHLPEQNRTEWLLAGNKQELNKAPEVLKATSGPPLLGFTSRFNIGEHDFSDRRPEPDNLHEIYSIDSLLHTAHLNRLSTARSPHTTPRPLADLGHSART